MRVQVVYTTHCKEAKLLAEDMARYARTYAKPMTDFNFHENANGQAQYNIYLKYLIRDFKDKELLKYTHVLNRCKNNHHSIQNCSLMPSKGNLQGVKGSIGKDRLDTFVYILSLYYSKEKNRNCT